MEYKIYHYLNLLNVLELYKIYHNNKLQEYGKLIYLLNKYILKYYQIYNINHVTTIYV